MTVNEFISIVAPIAVADWKARRIMLPSVVIAQGIKESNKGNSELAINANAIFGIKLNGWTGKSYRKKADEQNPDGSMRTDENCLWRAYDSWNESVIDHNTYISERRVVKSQTEPNFKAIIGETNVKKVIAGLIGNKNRSEVAERCTDPELRQYVLEGTTAYGYATGLNYAQSLLDDYIIKYNLTQYDIIEEEDNMSIIFALSAGHGYNTAGKRCLKSLDANQTREWYLNDRIADMVETDLTSNYNCKVIRMDDTTGKKDISLANRVKAANNAKAKAYISIHHNAGVNGGSGGGTVVFYYPSGNNKAKADRLYCQIVDRTGLVGNRSNPIANGKHLYEIKKTSMPCLLIENGFMDSKKDVPIILSEEHARETAEGIVAYLVSEYGLKKKTGATTTAGYVYFKACNKKYTTISTALTSIGVDSSYTYRKKIAKANSISGYCGTATQNTKMLNLLRAGLLRKP